MFGETPLQAGDIDGKIKWYAKELLKVHDQQIALIKGEHDPTDIGGLFQKGLDLHKHQITLYDGLRKLVE